MEDVRDIVERIIRHIDEAKSASDLDRHNWALCEEMLDSCVYNQTGGMKNLFNLTLGGLITSSKIIKGRYDLDLFLKDLLKCQEVIELYKREVRSNRDKSLRDTINEFIVNVLKEEM